MNLNHAWRSPGAPNAQRLQLIGQKRKREISTLLSKNLNLSDFQVERELGRGSYGVVYVVKNVTDNSTVVLKAISKLKSKRDVVENEVRVLQALKGKCKLYILCYTGFLEDDNYYYILTEFLGNYISLEDYIEGNLGNITQDEFLTISKNLVRGLQDIHEMGVAHRDIKPANIMINPNTLEIKFIDFGLACYQEECKNKNVFVGSLNYMAPELFGNSVAESLEVYQKTDIWSLVMTFFTIMHGQSFIETYFEQYFPNVNTTVDFYRIIQRLYNDRYYFYNLFQKFLRESWANPVEERIIAQSLEYSPKKRDLETILSLLSI